MQKFSRFLFAMGATMVLSTAANAGTLIVAGDSTIAFRFNSGVQTGAAPLAGNVTFAQTILGGGDTVRIFGGPGVPAYTDQLVQGYTGLGVNVSSFTTEITASALAGSQLFLAFFPSRAFTMSEAGVIRDYLDNGGTVFLSGEATTNPFDQPLGAAQNARINDLLGLIGAEMRLEVGRYDIGDQFATVADGEVVADPLTNGVFSFGYGMTTSVSGGNPLFLTNDKLAFVSYETIAPAGAIPEASTWAMLIAGFGLVGFAARRRSAIAA
jgi:hypothetical protein